MNDEQFEELKDEIRKTAVKLEYLQRIHEHETGRRLNDIGDLPKKEENNDTFDY